MATLVMETVATAAALQLKQGGSALADHQPLETLAPSAHPVSTKTAQAIQQHVFHSEVTAKRPAQRSVMTATPPMAMVATAAALRSKQDGSAQEGHPLPKTLALNAPLGSTRTMQATPLPESPSEVTAKRLVLRSATTRTPATATGARETAQR